METLEFTSREQVFDFLDDYARQRKEEIDRRLLSKDQGLIKSYWMETQPANGNDRLDILTILRSTNWHVTPIEDEIFYHVHDKEGTIGFLEPLSTRQMVLHSTGETRRIDQAVRHTVFSGSQLDFVWLAGSYLQIIWQNLILPQMPDRLVKFKFEHLARFEDSYWDKQDGETENELGSSEWSERRASVLDITERSGQIARFLPQLQASHAPFKAIKMLRIPAAGSRGGYDFWSWGKVTYRTQEFRDGRAQISSVTKLYEQTTRAIENRLWLQMEKTTLRNGSESFTLTGAPVTITFDPPLSLSTFHNLITVTFEKGGGPLRLWGNPICLGERKVHIYGIDLHLWQRIYLEITPRRMTIILPRGTCGNTIHRLVTNIQRYVAPTIEVFIGDIRYDDLIQDVFLGKAIN